jgi:hypothetical protein
VGLGFAVGSATAFVPFATGVTLMVTSSHRAATLGGLFLGEAGLIAAPFVGHAVVGEWKRGLRFAAYPALGAALLGGLALARPSIVSSSLSTPLQYAFVFALGESIFSSALGVCDVTGATARRSKALELHLVPYAAHTNAGVSLAGAW